MDVLVYNFDRLCLRMLFSADELLTRQSEADRSLLKIFRAIFVFACVYVTHTGRPQKRPPSTRHGRGAPAVAAPIAGRCSEAGQPPQGLCRG